MKSCLGKILAKVAKRHRNQNEWATRRNRHTTDRHQLNDPDGETICKHFNCGGSRARELKRVRSTPFPRHTPSPFLIHRLLEPPEAHPSLEAGRLMDVRCTIAHVVGRLPPPSSLSARCCCCLLVRHIMQNLQKIINLPSRNLASLVSPPLALVMAALAVHEPNIICIFRKVFHVA